MATISKRGKAWSIQYSENGQRVRKSLGPISQAQAEKIRKRIELELAHGSQLLVPQRAPLIKDFVPEYLAWYESEHPANYDRTEQIFRTHLIPSFGYHALDGIEPREAEAYKTRRRQKPAKAETVTKELRALKAMLNRAVEWEIISRNTISNVKEPKSLDSKPPRWYTIEEMQELYKGPHPDIWQVMANTGLRRAEMLNLREENRKPDRLIVLSAEGARTKSGKWREIPLNKSASSALDRMTLHDGYYAPRMTGNALTVAFRRNALKAGVGGNLHCLRHTYCSHLVMAGVPLRTVQLLAGHAHSSTTEKYAHLSPQHLADAAIKISL